MWGNFLVSWHLFDLSLINRPHIVLSCSETRAFYSTPDFRTNFFGNTSLIVYTDANLRDAGAGLRVAGADLRIAGAENFWE